MPGLYSQWLAFMGQSEIEARALQIRKRRRQRLSRFSASTMKKQLEKAFQTPVGDVLERLDAKMFALEEVHHAPAEEFAAEYYAGGQLSENAENNQNIATRRKITALKGYLKEILGILKKTTSYKLKKRHLITMPQLQKELTDLNLYTSYLYKQIEIYQNSKHCKQKVLFQFAGNGVTNLIRKYHRSIERYLPAEQEPAGYSFMKEV